MAPESETDWPLLLLPNPRRIAGCAPTTWRTTSTPTSSPPRAWRSGWRFGRSTRGGRWTRRRSDWSSSAKWGRGSCFRGAGPGGARSTTAWRQVNFENQGGDSIEKYWAPVFDERIHHYSCWKMLKCGFKTVAKYLLYKTGFDLSSCVSHTHSSNRWPLRHYLITSSRSHQLRLRTICARDNLKLKSNLFTRSLLHKRQAIRDRIWD